MHAPIVFIHGLIGTLQLPDMTAAFAPGRALAPDLLGYGTQREVPPEAIDLPAQVAHLQRLIERHFPGEAVHLVGHSVGGVVAMLFAQAHGQQVRSLVSVEGNFSLDDAFWSAAVARMPAAEACAMLEGFRAAPAAWLERAGVQVDAPLVRSLGVGSPAVPGVELHGRHLHRPDHCPALGVKTHQLGLVIDHKDRSPHHQGGVHRALIRGPKPLSGLRVKG